MRLTPTSRLKKIQKGKYCNVEVVGCGGQCGARGARLARPRWRAVVGWTLHPRRRVGGGWGTSRERDSKQEGEKEEEERRKTKTKQKKERKEAEETEKRGRREEERRREKKGEDERAKKKNGDSRESNPGPRPPEGRIMPLDHYPSMSTDRFSCYQTDRVALSCHVY